MGVMDGVGEADGVTVGLELAVDEDEGDAVVVDDEVNHRPVQHSRKLEILWIKYKYEALLLKD